MKTHFYRMPIPHLQTSKFGRKRNADRDAENTRASKHRRQIPSQFWDNLSRQWLTPHALRELDFRVHELSQKPQPTPLVPEKPRQPLDAVKVKRFARQGGPDLTDLRGCPFPDMTPSVTNSKSPSQSRKRSRTDGLASDSDRTSKSRKTSTYDRNFEQHLIDHGLYFESDRGIHPNNLHSLKERLERRRPSLSSSRFTEDDFNKFVQANKNAGVEDIVRSKVLPILLGSDNKPSFENVEFNNLAPLTDGTIVTCKPDYYEGSLPADLNRSVRESLNDFIVPSTDTSRPCLPNFFAELKGPDGSTAVATRQVTYDGAVGAHAIYRLRSYVDKATALDGNGYTITAIYRGGKGGGFLTIYVTHPTPSQASGRDIDYYVTPVDGWYLTSNLEALREGVNAFRNARDWAQKQRKELIDRANEVCSIQSTTEDSPQGSDTSMDELSLDYPSHRRSLGRGGSRK